MSHANVISLVVDRWQAGYVGAYGNTWIETPSANRLAGRGFVFDQALAVSSRLADGYRGYFAARHALAASHDRPWLAALEADGVHRVLLTDAPEVADLAEAALFDETVRVGFAEPTIAAETLARTAMASLWAVASGLLADLEEPFLLWIHSRGLCAAWDAPYGFRAAYHDAEDPSDPAPPEDLVPRVWPMADGLDPDELLGLRRAYAGQITALDALMGIFLNEVDRFEWARRTLVSLTSPRGYALGEHGQLGHAAGALYSETVQVPWMVRLPDAALGAARSQALVQPADLGQTFFDWLTRDVGAGARPGGPWARSALELIERGEPWLRESVLLGSAERPSGIRTPGWYYHLPCGELGEAPFGELFAKPDDRWEMNEVASRCPEIVSAMEELWPALCGAVESGIAAPKIDDSLVRPRR